MKEEEIRPYLGHKVRITCVFGSGEPIFYTGYPTKMTNSSLVFIDKFQKEILISVDAIKQLEGLE